ncbi:MAG TPA: TetM/TetW/TetO/TetS family tetracycline resistance ribosomal protection protein [Candidatus Anaerofilum faecale]|nr:TetM/TetW/TetO/TetS family tetracycline resistance ribosomal protection protein [Candidatus Anaerofilum faecale]
MGERTGGATAGQHICAGLLAHVDAGKTTLSEALLYKAGCLRKLGRVDHRDAFLDTDEAERERGITIFSKQALLPLQDVQVTLVDTPGHVDFSAEAERTLQILDVAVLVISGTDGVQGHTRTLWNLLKEYDIPAFLFVNKMDLPGPGRKALADSLKQLDAGCIDFTAPDAQREEELAMCSEQRMEAYLEGRAATDEEIAALVRSRKVFPCWYGSALKLDGVDALLEGLRRFAPRPEYPHTFGASVYKIARDPQGARLTFLKVTGGALHVRDTLCGEDEQGQWQEKAAQLRLYSGAGFTAADEVPAGGVCAVTGLTRTRPGQGLGHQPDAAAPVLQPVLNYQVLLPDGFDAHTALQMLRQLQEEDPQLHVTWNEPLRQIHLQLMGQVQLEILQRRLRERFGLEASFGPGSILYRETIKAPSVGVGHFEPLRHYAEVHLLLEPGAPGSGIQLDSRCSEDVLDRNWQRLILSHLAECEHPGVLAGMPVTDLRITLLTGKAHLKHTEGGDFRQATFRALRQGLRKAESVLLEPYYTFRLELPPDAVGRGMADLQRMSASFAPPRQEGETAVLEGTVPVAEIQDYARQLAGYTHGHGRLQCTLKGYFPCHDQPQVLGRIGYDPDADTDHPADSVFCSHGAGFVVKWNEVDKYQHLVTPLRPSAQPEQSSAPVRRAPAARGSAEEEKELEEIFRRTYGEGKWTTPLPSQVTTRPLGAMVFEAADEYLLVDGYNILFAWDDLKELARQNLDAARQSLMDILSNYQGFRQCAVILVFDAYKVHHTGEVMRYHNIDVVYTKEAETADMYIEQATYKLSKNRRVRVATSDGMEQLIILGHGALRVSARTFRQEVEQANSEIAAIIQRHNSANKW